MKMKRRLSYLLFAAASVFAAGSAYAQITSTSDESPPPVGSLRFGVENSTSGQVLDVRIGDAGSTSSIELTEVLVFDNDVEIDNSSANNGFLEVIAPESDLFLDIDPNVDVVFRDVELIGLGSTLDDDIEIGAGGSLTLDVERQDQRLSVDVTGAGSLVKEGSATLRLTGDNTLTGGVTVLDGDLSGDAGSFGPGTITLGSDRARRNARLVFDFSGRDILLAPIVDNSSGGGSVSIVKAGSGSLNIAASTISGTLDFEVDDGQLVVGNGNLVNGHEFDIREDGALQIVTTGEVTSDSLFSGEGSIETRANAVGPLVLTGDLSNFTGQFDVTLGTAASSLVRVAPTTAPSGGLRFPVDLQAGTTFEVQDAVGVRFGGNVTGAGAFSKSGDATTTLSGTHSHTGGTNVLGGTLIGSTRSFPGDVSMSSGTTLVFSQDSDASYAGRISDTGGSVTLRKTGAGRLTLSSTSPAAGAFVVEAGGLRLASGVDLPGLDLTIGTGALNGAASLSTDYAPLAGPLDPSNRYSVGGDLTLASDSTLQVTLADATNVNTRIVAGGEIRIDPGAKLEVSTVQGGTYDTSLTWDILSGASILPGGAFDIQQSLYFFTIQGNVVGGNTYRLSLTDSGNTLVAAAKTSNQAVIGAQLDVFRTAPVVPAIEPEIAAYQDAITSLTEAEVTGVLDAVSPDDLAAGTPIALAGASRAFRSLSDRLAVMRRGWVGRPDPFASPPPRRRPSVQAGPSVSSMTAHGGADAPEDRTVDLRHSPNDWQAWLEGQALFGEIGSSDVKEIEYVSGGPVIGADRRLGEDVRVGFAFSGGGLNYETSAGNGDGDGGSVEGTVYAAWLGDPVQCVAAARYARAWIDTERKLVAGTASDSISGDLDGNTFGAYVELTGSLSAPLARTGLPLRGIDVAPLVSLAWNRVTWDAFDEGGRSPLAVKVDEQEVDSAQTSLGLRLSGEQKMEEGVLIRPRFKLLWNHEWADVDREVSGTFVSAPTTGTTPFTVEGAEMPRDHAEIGLGWEVGFAANANLFLDWQGRFGEDFVENAISFGGRVVW